MANKIEYFNINRAPFTIKLKWKLAIQEVLKSGQFIGGEVLTKFENNWSDYLGCKFSTGVGNGYDGLVVALKALGIKKGERVAVPAHTFIATWLAVDAVGAVPIGVDCDDFGLIDIKKLAMLKNISVVIPVHMHGRMVDMKKLLDWATPKGIKVIEDCAQAHGAEFSGKKAGTWGDIGVFSLYPTKNLGAFGDAGIIATNNKELSVRLNSIKNYGTKKDKKYEYEFIGLNSRLDPIQASILNVNLNFLDDWNQRRMEIANLYLQKVINLSKQKHLSTGNSVFHHFTIRTRNRAKVEEFLNTEGIQTIVHYPSSAAASYQRIKKKKITKFPIADQIAKETLSLPLHQWLKNSEINKIIDALNSKTVQNNLIVP